MSKIPAKEFDEPLSETVSFKLTSKEVSNLTTVAKSNNFSPSELLRNLIKEYLYKYSPSENLSKNMYVSGKIDMIILERRLISSRKITNLSKMREILLDFEGILSEDKKLIDWKELIYFKKQLDEVMKIIYENDEWLAQKLDAQWYKITMHKNVIHAEKMKNV